MNNVETRIIRHDPPSFAFYVYVMLITMRARNFCLQLDRKLANWLPIYPTGIYGSRLPIRIDVYPTWRHFSSMSSSREVPFLQPWIRTRTAVSEDVSTAMVAPSLQEVGNQTTFVHARIGDDSRRIRRLYPVLFKAIHKISKRPPCALLPLSPPRVPLVFHVRGFDRFPINENAVLNTVKRGTANATIYAAR